MNVQHLESLYDKIEGFTGVKVKERVPDYVWPQADQIVNVDLPAEDLQERLRRRQVYPARPHRAAPASISSPSTNLTRLRESPWKRSRKSWIASGGKCEGNGTARRSRNGHGLPEFPRPERPSLLRKASRLADRYHAPWYAVYIQTPRERPGAKSTPPRSAASANNSASPSNWAASRCRSTARISRCRRRLCPGIRHHPHRPGPVHPPLVSPLVRANRHSTDCCTLFPGWT